MAHKGRITADGILWSLGLHYSPDRTPFDRSLVQQLALPIAAEAKPQSLYSQAAHLNPHSFISAPAPDPILDQADGNLYTDHQITCDLVVAFRGDNTNTSVNQPGNTPIAVNDSEWSNRGMKWKSLNVILQNLSSEFFQGV